MFFFARKSKMPAPEDALPGRQTPMRVAPRHFVLGTAMAPPSPENMQLAMFDMGCFWGAERYFWQTPGVYSTAEGYGAGYTPHPTYEEVCSGLTGHNEVVRVVFDPAAVSYEALLRVFWENHDPKEALEKLKGKTPSEQASLLESSAVIRASTTGAGSIPSQACYRL